jgi:hypothetical protein
LRSIFFKRGKQQKSFKKELCAKSDNKNIHLRRKSFFLQIFSAGELQGRKMSTLGLYIKRRLKHNRSFKMDFFGRKSNNALLNDFLNALNGDNPGAGSSSLSRRSEDRSRRNDGFDSFLDDSLPDDFVFSGWGGLDDEE